MTATRSFIIAAVLAVLAVVSALAFIMYRPSADDAEDRAPVSADISGDSSEVVSEVETGLPLAPPVFDIERGESFL